MREQYPYTRLGSPFSRRPTRQHVVIIATIAILCLLGLGFFWHRGSIPVGNSWMGQSLRTPPYFPTNIYIETVPSDVPYTAIILYLISWRRAAELIASLSYLRDNLPMKYPWPIVLMHPGDFDNMARQTEFKRRLFEYLNGGHDAWKFVDRIEFVKVEFELPESVPTDVTVVDPVFPDRWPGYHHMCRFFTSQIFDHPRLQNVTYYFRLDTDSYINGPACYDPLEVMYAKDLSYAYRMQNWDPTYVVKGMYELMVDYTTTYPELLDRIHQNQWGLPGREKWDTDQFPLYYNNFEIVKLEAFRRPDIRAWFDEINKDPMRFYKYRWGDAPLRFATVQMFFDKYKDVELLCGIPYVHYYQAPENCGCTA